MSRNGSTRSISESRPVSTACPVPAEASTTTDRVVTARIAQRALRRAGGRGPPRAGRGGGRGVVRGRGDRGGVGKGAPPDDGRAWILSTVGRYDLRPGPSPPGARTGVPRTR